ncbi:MAG: Ig-like domain-containing protein [Gemmatimonadota bacterium]
MHGSPARHARLVSIRLQFSAALAIVLITSCGGATEPTVVQPVRKAVASVTITSTSAAMTQGESQTLLATVRDASGSTLTDRTVAWSSSAAGVATVSSSGVVSAVAAGTAVISATSEGVSGTLALTVNALRKPVASITVTSPTSQLFIGDTLRATAIVSDASGAALTDRPVTWTSSAAGVATVSSSGTVSAIAAGTATISAAAEGVTGTFALTVVRKPVASITVTSATGFLLVGDTLRATAVVRDASGAVLTDRVLAWSSTDSAVATVTSAGTIRGLRGGGAAIGATAEGITGKVTITVTPLPTITVAVAPTRSSMDLGETVTFVATVKDLEGRVQTGQTIAWSVADTSGTITPGGVFTPILPGTPVVTATVQTVTGSGTVSVKAPQLARAFQGLTGHFAGFADDAQRVSYQWGFSMFSAVNPVKPGRDELTQLGWGLFMLPNNIEDANGVTARRPDGVCQPGARLPDSFQSNEGGMGSWGDILFPTTMPKFTITATADCYGSGIGGPAYTPGGGTPLDASAIGFAQLSNRLLITPDRLNFTNPSTPSLFGYGWIALPIIPANTAPVANGPTGGNSWTLFMNTANYKGAVGFYTPAFWTALNALGGTSAGYGLDARGAIYSLLTLEVGFTPNFAATSGGVEYRRVPRMTFGADANRRAVLLQDFVQYDKSAIWNGVATWVAGGSAVTQFGTAGTKLTPLVSQGQSLRMLDGGSDTVAFAGQITSTNFKTAGGGQAWGLQWGTTAEAGVIPEYYKKVNARWTAIPKSDVPRTTWLQDQTFAPLTTKSATALSTSASSPWAQSGWAAGPFTTALSDGSTVTYVWYKFIDQPAITRLNLGAADRAKIQAWIESVHRQGANSFTFAAPTSGTLASVDPGHLVVPPAGFEFGYVPIAIAQR